MCQNNLFQCCQRLDNIPETVASADSFQKEKWSCSKYKVWWPHKLIDRKVGQKNCLIYQDPINKVLLFILLKLWHWFLVGIYMILLLLFYKYYPYYIFQMIEIMGLRKLNILPPFTTLSSAVLRTRRPACPFCTEPWEFCSRPCCGHFYTSYLLWSSEANMPGRYYPGLQRQVLEPRKVRGQSHLATKG